MLSLIHYVSNMIDTCGIHRGGVTSPPLLLCSPKQTGSEPVGLSWPEVDKFLFFPFYNQTNRRRVTSNFKPCCDLTEMHTKTKSLIITKPVGLQVLSVNCSCVFRPILCLGRKHKISIAEHLVWCICRSQTELHNMFLMLPVILVYTKDQIN